MTFDLERIAHFRGRYQSLGEELESANLDPTLSEAERLAEEVEGAFGRGATPDKPFKWTDGVFAVTVDPENCEGLRAYIRNQQKHHTQSSLVPAWELEE